MDLSGARGGGDITFTAWLVGSGATATFALLADDGTSVNGVQQIDGSWAFLVSAVDLANRSAWPDTGYPVLKAIMPTWLSGNPTVHLKADRGGADFPNSNVIGGDATVLTALTTNGMTVATAFGLTFQ